MINKDNKKDPLWEITKTEMVPDLKEEDLEEDPLDNNNNKWVDNLNKDFKDLKWGLVDPLKEFIKEEIPDI